MSSRTLIDISRLGTDTTWPSVATEVNGYLQNWIAAIGPSSRQHFLRLAADQVTQLRNGADARRCSPFTGRRRRQR